MIGKTLAGQTDGVTRIVAQELSYFLAILLVKLRRLGFTIQEMVCVMEDESFANLDGLLIQKRHKIQREIDDLLLRVEEIDAFLESGKEENK